MGYLGTKPANQITDSTLIADGTITTSDLASGLTVNFADGSASTPSITNDGDTNTGIFFPAADTIAFAEGGAEVARFDSNGNLGVGTTSPTNFANYKTIAINGTSGGVLDLQNNGTSTGLIFCDNQLVTIRGGTSTPLVFQTNGANERMRIDSSGRVLVGLTSLPVSSSKLNISFNNNSGTYGLNVYHQSSSYSDSAIVFYGHSNSTMGYIYCNGSSTQYGTSSDYRLKENVNPMTGALAKVQALKPVTYTWKETGQQGEGFIAHELAEVCPDAVNGKKDAVNEDGSIKPQGIDTSFLVATLTAAIQEQQAIITEQSLALQDLKARIETLENK